MIDITIILKALTTVTFLVALIYALKNYQISKYISGVWTLMALTMGVAFILCFIRFFKEFIWYNELEIVKVCLIPVLVTLILTASLEIKRDILKPL